MIVNSQDVWDGALLGAVSLTYDDGNASQLERAVPLMTALIWRQLCRRLAAWV